MLPWGRMGSPFRGDILLPLFLPRSTVRTSQREGVEVTSDAVGCCRSVGLFLFCFLLLRFNSNSEEKSWGQVYMPDSLAAYASRALIHEGRRLTYTDSLSSTVGDTGKP